MRSIFRPLDPDERPAADTGGMRARNVLTGSLAPGPDDPTWKTMLSWLWMPALILFITVELWLQVPPVAGWLLVIGFCVAYAIFAWLAYRKR